VEKPEMGNSLTFEVNDIFKAKEKKTVKGKKIFIPVNWRCYEYIFNCYQIIKEGSQNSNHIINILRITEVMGLN
jgi:hypothetical protein